ncbi:unnamed protein product [Somion occarium]|uniref:RING-type domain-containing protein n=1 Tax=Somion occarium TaxID=3059160 RepID=A0ABP1DNU0_9APHY
MITCNTCKGRQFVSQQAYEQHVRDSPAHKLFRCSVCSKTSFSSAAARDAHFRDTHETRVAVAPSIPVPNKHSETSHPTILCGCGIIVYKAALPVHYQNSTSHPSCSTCHLGFETIALHDSHVLSTHPLRCCIPCKLALSSEYALTQHYYQSNKHTRCDLCKIGFRENSNYDDHLKTHHARSPSPPPVNPVHSLGTPSSVRTSLVTDISTSASPFKESSTSSVSQTSLSAPATKVTHNFELAATPPKTNVIEPRREGTVSLEVPGSLSRATSEPPPTSLSIRTSPPLPAEPETDVPLLSAVTDRATIITQASAPTSPARTSQSLSYAISEPTPDLTTDSSYSMVSSNLNSQHSDLEVSSPLTIVPPLLASSPVPSVRSMQSVGEVVNATISRTRSSCRHSTPRARQASLPPSEIPTPQDVSANVSMAISNVPSLHNDSRSRTRSTARDSTLPRSKSSRTKVTSGASGVPLGSTSGPKAHYNPLNPSSTLSMTAGAEKELSWHCRICLKNPSEPTVTMCGHLFCHGCIIQELARGLQCPVCKRVMLLRLHVGDDKVYS